MKSEVELRVHETNPELFEALERVFGSDGAEGSRWVNVRAENGVLLVFFARDDETHAEDD